MINYKAIADTEENGKFRGNPHVTWIIFLEKDEWIYTKFCI